MRLHSRLILGVCGFSLAAATGVIAAPPDGSHSGLLPMSSAGAIGGPAAPVIAGTVPTDPQPHKHKSIFARRHCVDCQRALAKKQTGIDVPPPPGFANDPTAHIHGVGVTVENCPRCKSMGVIAGPVVPGGAESPGFAVVDGSASAHDRPGFAVVEPTPIGVFRGGVGSAANPRLAANGRPGAGYDPAVVPSSIPPAQVGVPEGKHSRPHVLGHLFGISQMRHDMQDHRARRKQDGPAHASITYDENAKSVTELPASMVYGKAPH